MLGNQLVLAALLTPGMPGHDFVTHDDLNAIDERL
jgi:hypothetical protein